MKKLKKVTVISAGIILSLAAFLLISSMANKLMLRKWLAAPQLPGKMFQVNNHKLYATVSGSGKDTIVIETGLGCDSSEWWPVQYELSKTAKVITYDRAGYGWSEAAPFPRTSETIACELHSLLKSIHATPPYILVGHSNGGVYVQHFARIFPNEVKGVVLIDPAGIKFHTFQMNLIETAIKTYERENDRYKLLANLGLVRIGKNVGLLPLFSKSYHEYSAETKKIISASFSNPDYFDACKSENTSLLKISIPSMEKAPGFPDIPLLLMTVEPPKYENLIALGVKSAVAKERVKSYQEYINDYLNLSSQSKWIIAKDCGHMIHLEKRDFILQAIKDFQETTE